MSVSEEGVGRATFVRACCRSGITNGVGNIEDEATRYAEAGDCKLSCCTGVEQNP